MNAGGRSRRDPVGRSLGERGGGGNPEDIESPDISGIACGASETLFGVLGGAGRQIDGGCNVRIEVPFVACGTCHCTPFPGDLIPLRTRDMDAFDRGGRFNSQCQIIPVSGCENGQHTGSVGATISAKDHQPFGRIRHIVALRPVHSRDQHAPVRRFDIQHRGGIMLRMIGIDPDLRIKPGEANQGQENEKYQFLQSREM